jgi:ketosteroid isomerase-like protein
MSTEANKDIVRSFNRAIEVGDLDQLALLMTDDATFWVSPTTIGSGTYTEETWLQEMSGMFGQLAKPMTLQMGDFTAEDDRVSVTASGIYH